MGPEAPLGSLTDHVGPNAFVCTEGRLDALLWRHEVGTAGGRLLLSVRSLWRLCWLGGALSDVILHFLATQVVRGLVAGLGGCEPRRGIEALRALSGAATPLHVSLAPLLVGDLHITALSV